MSTILSWDLVWRRLAVLPAFRDRSQSDYRFVAIGKQLSMASGQSNSAPIDFPVGAVILGVAAGVSPVGAVATAEVRGLNAVRVGLDYSGSKGAIISGGRMNAAALFGNMGNRQFPAKELLIEQGDTITVSVDNLSTTSITFDIVFHAMISGRIQ